MEELIKKFNAQFPVGSTVRWRLYKSLEFKEYTVRCAAYMNGGTPVTFLKERSGMVSIEPDFVDYK